MREIVEILVDKYFSLPVQPLHYSNQHDSCLLLHPCVSPTPPCSHCGCYYWQWGYTDCYKATFGPVLCYIVPRFPPYSWIVTYFYPSASLIQSDCLGPRVSRKKYVRCLLLLHLPNHSHELVDAVVLSANLCPFLPSFFAANDSIPCHRVKLYNMPTGVNE